MMKRKFTALVIAAGVMLCAVAPAFADTADYTFDPSNPESTPAVTVSVSVAPTYMVTIPATVDLEEDDTGDSAVYKQDMKISASAGLKLKKGEKLTVSVSSANNFELQGENNAALAYGLFNGELNVDITKAAVFETEKNATEQTVTLTAKTTEAPTYAGNYTDTLTFSIAITTETIA